MEDSLCGHVRVITALAAGHGSRIFGAPSLALDEEQGQRVWMVRVEHEFVPDDLEISRFMSGVGELARLDVDGLVPLMLLDREVDFAIVGWSAMDGAAPIIGRGGRFTAGQLRENAVRLASALALLHSRGRVHGLACPANVVLLPDGRAWWWMHGLADCVDHTALISDRPRTTEGLAPELARGEVSAASDVFGWATAVVTLAHEGTMQECIAAARAGAGVFANDPALTALIIRALDADPGRRPSDAEVLLATLAATTRSSPNATTAARLAPGRALANTARDHVPPPSTISLTAGISPGDSLAGLASFGDVPRTGREGSHSGLRDASLGAPTRHVGQRDAITLDAAEPSGMPALADLPELVDLPEPLDIDGTDGGGADAEAASLLEPEVNPAVIRAPGLATRADPAAAAHASASIFESMDRALSAFEEDESPAAASLAIALDEEQADLRAAAGGAAEGREAGAPGGPSAPSGPAAATSAAFTPPGFARPVDVPLEKLQLRERLPGPHGPSPALMNTVAWLVAAAGLTFGAIALSAKLDLPTPPSAGAGEYGDTIREVPAAVATGGAVTGGPQGDTGEAAELVLEDPPEPVPEPPMPCPTGTADLSEDVCIDIGEYPGLRRLPTRNVTFAEASATCKAREARLCTLEEWRSACGGPGKQRFPYGETFVRGACNIASIAGFYGEAVHGGSYGECTSPVGARDMVGNVGEWVQGGVAVGGDFGTSERDATCQAKGSPPNGYSGADVGFRCCIDRRLPKPP